MKQQNGFRKHIVLIARRRFKSREFKNRKIVLSLLSAIVYWVFLQLIPAIDLWVEILLAVVPAILRLWMSYIFDVFVNIPEEIYTSQKDELAHYSSQGITITVSDHRNEDVGPAGIWINHDKGISIGLNNRIERMYAVSGTRGPYLPEYNGCSFPNPERIHYNQPRFMPIEAVIKHSDRVNTNSAFLTVEPPSTKKDLAKQIPIESNTEIEISVMFEFLIGEARIIPHKRLKLRLLNEQNNLIIRKVSDWNS